MENTAPSLQPGSQLGPYRIVRLLGAGGMGEVYEAIDSSLHRRVALKIILPALLGNQDCLKRFLVEGKALAQINHKNIVTVYSLGAYDGTYHMAMELIEGQGLNDFIHDEEIPAPLLLSLFEQILEGVNALHSRGIIHRDLKPSNIIVTDDEVVKIVDLGIAKTQTLFDSDSSTTKPGSLIGSVSYLAPEIILGHSATIQSDMWAVGLILYEMLFRKKAISGSKNYEVIEKIKTQKIKIPTQARTDLPKIIFEILNWLLEKDPNLRAPNAELVLVQLKSSSQNLVRTKRDATHYAATLLSEPEVISSSLKSDFSININSKYKAFLRYRPAAIAAAVLLIFTGVFFYSNSKRHTPVSVPAAVEAFRPSNPQKGQQFWLKPGEGVRFEWVQPTDIKVGLQVASDPGFTQILINTEELKSPYVLFNLKRDEKYYWRLRGQGPDGSNIFSEGNDFFIGDISPPTLISPLPGSLMVTSQQVHLFWQDKPMVTSYRLQISNDPRFSTIIKDLTVNGSRQDVPPLVAGTYFWRVTALNNANLANLWSETWEINFLVSHPILSRPTKRRAPASDSPVLAPELLGQQDRFVVSYSRPVLFRDPASVRVAIVNPPLLQWKGSSHDSTYNIQISKSSDFAAENVVDEVVHGFIYKWVNAKPGTYYWHVRSFNKTTYSASRKFTVSLAPPQLTKKLSKNFNHNSKGIILSWAPRYGASGYRILVARDPSFDPVYFDAKSAEPQIFLPLSQGGNYFIRLAALDMSGNQVSDFSIISTLEANEQSWLVPPSPKLPIEGISIVPMNDGGAPTVFKWKPTEGANNYLLEVALEPTFERILLSQRTTESQFILTAPLPVGTIYWHVRSEKGTHFSDWCKTTYFEISTGSSR